MSASASTKVAHMVYFTLHDNSDAARAKLVADCQKYLTDHPGVVYFSVGTHVADLARPVNQQFDVGLHVVFASRADHDRYQTAERHKQFIVENKESWKEVRVFDSYVS